MKYFILILVFSCQLVISQSQNTDFNYDIDKFNTIKISTKFYIDIEGSAIKPSITDIECMYCALTDIPDEVINSLKEECLEVIKNAPKIPNAKENTECLLPILMKIETDFPRQKKIYFFNELDQEISFKDFIENSHPLVNYKTKIENDTLVINRLNPNAYSKVISQQAVNQTYAILAKLNQNKINTKKPIIIHFVSKNDIYLGSQTDVKNYTDAIEKLGDKGQVYFLNQNSNTVVDYETIKFITDDYNFFKKFYFKDSPYNINHLKLYPNGTIKIAFGNSSFAEVTALFLD